MPPAKRPMPKWTKAPEALVATFSEALARLPGAEPRKMFGYPAAFANGNMMAGLFQDKVVLRLPAEERDRVTALGGQPFAPMPGRVMREYVTAPASIVASAATLKPWLEKAFAFAVALPPKVRKSAKPRARPAKRAPPRKPN